MPEEFKSNPQLLAIFRIEDSWYAVDAMLLQEVILTGKVTPVYGAMDYITGVINLRGKIVTVIDPFVKIGLRGSVENHHGCILILPWLEEQMGLIVDEIEDVIEIEISQIIQPPSSCEELINSYYKGIYAQKNRIISILDTKKLLEVPKKGMEGI